jgi:3-hydroxy-9,10-secoandrosta-1,3,5(10)-triene-9,17-dione monooxygenase
MFRDYSAAAKNLLDSKGDEKSVASKPETTMHQTPPSLSHLLDLAHTVGAQAERTADEAERNRRVDDSVVRALIESGLMKVLRPKRFGGYESGFPDFVRVGQTLAHYDVSLAWLYGIIGDHHWWGAYAEPQLQDELWRDNPDCAFADSFNPTGKAEPTEGGFRLTGRWGFQSGLPWSEWSSVGAITPFEAGAPPEYLMLFLPKRDYRSVDDWHTVGLRGSASASIEVDNVFVPRHRAFRAGETVKTGLAPGQAYNPGPLYQVPFVAGLCISLVPPSLGGAQAVAQRFREAAKLRTPQFQQRQAELVYSQTVLAESMLTLETLEQMLYRNADELMEIGRGATQIDPLTRIRLFGSRAYIARRSREVLDSLMDLAGSRSIFEDNPLQRFWRDVHVMGQHVALNYEAAMRNYGRVLMGLNPDLTFY